MNLTCEFSAMKFIDEGSRRSRSNCLCLPGGGNDKSTNLVLSEFAFSSYELFQYRNNKSKCLSRTGDSLDHYIFILHEKGNRSRLVLVSSECDPLIV